jgi:two-component system, sensor histidine kinase
VNGARILLVDDDPALLTSLSAALRLREPKVTVDRAESAACALKHIESEKYDAIVTDIKMPGMDGLSLLAELRKRIPEVPTLLITGHGQHDLAVQALRGGAFDFIQKPIDRDYFIASLKRAVQVRQLSRQVELQKRDLERHAANLERKVMERTRQLQDANQAKDKFLAMLAHELRNPLATIRSAVELQALCLPDDPARTEAQEAIAEQVRHMARMLDDLLDISRITRNRITLEQECLDCRDVVATGVRSLRGTFAERRLDVDVQIGGKPVWVMGDRTRLEQIVVNILNNAAKYTDPGGRVRVRLDSQDGFAVLAIQDSGIGISPEMLNQVFELFTQVDDSLHRSQGGLGIGLSLVKRLVEMHGGTVEAASEGANRGSTFTVRIPLSDQLFERPTRVPAPIRRGSSYRVLVVEDNRAIATLTRKLLEVSGHCVVGVAADGPAAIEAARTLHPQIVLIDIGLPGMDGYELAAQLRNLPSRNGQLLIALTGYGQEEDRRRSTAAGFDLHLVKPVSLDALQEAFSGCAVAHRRN